MTAARHDDLWDYAVALYGRPGVQSACLALQDEHGVDVPCLLFAAWMGAVRGVTLDAAAMAAVQARMADWQRRVVEPLRRVRRHLKDEPQPGAGLAGDALRGQLKAVELEAERIELAALAAIGSGMPCQPGADAELAGLNMQALVSGLGASASAAEQLSILKRASAE